MYVAMLMTYLHFYSEGKNSPWGTVRDQIELNYKVEVTGN